MILVILVETIGVFCICQISQFSLGVLIGPRQVSADIISESSSPSSVVRLN